MEKEKEIINILQECYDPEITIDLWNLGLIYDIDLKKTKTAKYDVEITMSLTTPGCSMGQHMSDDIKNKVNSLKDINDVEVRVTFDPQWKPEMMTDLARKKLGFDPVKTSQQKKEINLIPFNPFPGSNYKRPSNMRVTAFKKVLQKEGYITTVRTTRGEDIMAACGQLVGQVNDRTKKKERQQKKEKQIATRLIS